MAVLDSNIVLIALPTITAELPGTNAFDALWIIMRYILVTAVLLLAFGRLSDIFGRVKLYNTGSAVFTFGDYDQLVVPMVIAGLGGDLRCAQSSLGDERDPGRQEGRGLRDVVDPDQRRVPAEPGDSVRDNGRERPHEHTAAGLRWRLGLHRPGHLQRFERSLHGVFLLMGGVGLLASVPAFLAKKPGRKAD
ncbi:MAG: hypothetical protein HY297_05395 [Thaumarchaeota archaeon]|nr:hypothetical protein [Nitrososphaerota archaeon]